ncbi:Uncharacterised protein [Chlamydia trachomatis]|nr:Uncharacterised protein [Chlamydia trachomatis]
MTQLQNYFFSLIITVLDIKNITNLYIFDRVPMLRPLVYNQLNKMVATQSHPYVGILVLVGLDH